MWQRRNPRVALCGGYDINSFVTTSLAATPPPQAPYALSAQVMAVFQKKYPRYIRVRLAAAGMQDCGVFRMYIDENGVVTKIGVVKSTATHSLIGARPWASSLESKAGPTQRGGHACPFCNEVALLGAGRANSSMRFRFLNAE